MAPRIQRAKSVGGKLLSQNSQENPENLSDILPVKKPKRAKNYSAEESAALIRVCDKFHVIISLNSHTDQDRKEKEKAWNTIKRDFVEYCSSQGIEVSENLCLIPFQFKKKIE